eukprot:SAG25_NODE_100_length_15542_cov_15.293337_11_plen_447_part_00
MPLVSAWDVQIVGDLYEYEGNLSWDHLEKGTWDGLEKGTWLPSSHLNELATQVHHPPQLLPPPRARCCSALALSAAQPRSQEERMGAPQRRTETDPRNTAVGIVPARTAADNSGRPATDVDPLCAKRQRISIGQFVPGSAGKLRARPTQAKVVPNAKVRPKKRKPQKRGNVAKPKTTPTSTLVDKIVPTVAPRTILKLPASLLPPLSELAPCKAGCLHFPPSLDQMIKASDRRKGYRVSFDLVHRRWCHPHIKTRISHPADTDVSGSKRLSAAEKQSSSRARELLLSDTFAHGFSADSDYRDIEDLISAFTEQLRQDAHSFTRLPEGHQWCVGGSIEKTLDLRHRDSDGASVFLHFVCCPGPWTGSEQSNKTGNSCTRHCRLAVRGITIGDRRQPSQEVTELRKCTWLKCCYGRKRFASPPLIPWCDECALGRRAAAREMRTKTDA